MLKKHMTPLKKGGQLVKHKGKGEAAGPQATPFGNSNPGSMSLQDYAKATPMAQPGAQPVAPEIE
jgi:hypothetical protein